MLVLDQLARLLDWSGFQDIHNIIARPGLLLEGGAIDLVRFRLLGLSDILENTPGTQVLDGALPINAAIEHANEVVRAGKDQIYVVSYENLAQD